MRINNLQSKQYIKPISKSNFWHLSVTILVLCSLLIQTTSQAGGSPAPTPPPSRDLAKACLPYASGQRMTTEEKSLVARMWADQSWLERLRTGQRNKQGENYFEALNRILKTYLDIGHQQKYTDQYTEAILANGREAYLHQKLFEIIAGQQEYTDYEGVVRGVRLNNFDFRRLTQVMAALDKAIQRKLDQRLLQIEARMDVSPSPKLSQAYLLVSSEREYVRNLIAIVHSDFLNSLNLTLNEIKNQLFFYRETVYYTTALTGVAVTGFALGKIKAASRFFDLATQLFGTRFGSSMAGAAIAPLGSSAITLATNRWLNVQQAWMMSSENNTPFSCELRLANQMRPAKTWDEIRDHLMASTVMGALGGPVIMAFGRHSRIAVAVAMTVVGLSGGVEGLNAYQMKVKGDSIYDDAIQMQRIALAADEMDQGKLNEATAKLQEARDYYSRSGQHVVGGILNSAIVLALKGDMREALEASETALSRIVAGIMTKSMDNTAVGIEIWKKALFESEDLH